MKRFSIALALLALLVGATLGWGQATQIEDAGLNPSGSPHGYYAVYETGTQTPMLVDSGLTDTSIYFKITPGSRVAGYFSTDTTCTLQVYLDISHASAGAWTLLDSTAANGKDVYTSATNTYDAFNSGNPIIAKFLRLRVARPGIANLGDAPSTIDGKLVITKD